MKKLTENTTGNKTDIVKSIFKNINTNANFNVAQNFKFIGNLAMQLGSFINISSIMGFIPNIALPVTIEVGLNVSVPGLTFAISGFTFITMSLLSRIINVSTQIVSNNDLVDTKTLLLNSQEFFRSVEVTYNGNKKWCTSGGRAMYKKRGGNNDTRGHIVPQGRLVGLFRDNPVPAPAELKVEGELIELKQRERVYKYLKDTMDTLVPEQSTQQNVTRKQNALSILKSGLFLDDEANTNSFTGGRRTLSTVQKKEIVTFLQSKKRQELHDYCKLKGIVLSSDSKKDDYINAIVAHHKKNKRSNKSKR
jgi:hypothetical protein